MNWAILAVSSLAVVVAVAIAVWEHKVAQKFRRDDEARNEKKAQLDQAERSHQTTTRTFELAITDTEVFLNHVAEIDTKIRHNGPVTDEFISGADLLGVQGQLENLSDRCPPLCDPLQAVMVAVRKLDSVHFPSDEEVSKAYANALTGPSPTVPMQFLAHAIGAVAIKQYAAATELHRAIVSAWEAIHRQRSGEG